MTQLGETISVAFLSDEVHTEATCPWHQPAEQLTAQPMPVTDDDDDNLKTMPANDGGKLGRDLGAKANVKIRLQYNEKKKLLIWYAKDEDGKRKRQTGQVYAPGRGKEYELQFAPHHLIPGNQSLEGSEIVAYLGDDDVIGNFADGVASKLRKGTTIGYDVNSRANGEWLPSPYALSMGKIKGWPSDAMLKIAASKLGENVAGHLAAFKEAYAYASMAKTGSQFHHSHTDYGVEVTKALRKLAERLKTITNDVRCPETKEKETSRKLNPPFGLKGRLNILSGNLRRLVTGKVWHPPMFTDSKYSQPFVTAKSSGDPIPLADDFESVL